MKITEDKFSANMVELKQYINQFAIKNSLTHGPLYSGVGGEFNWLFAFHDFFVNTLALDAFASEFWNRFKKHAPLQIAGLEISGIPLVIAILYKAKELNIEASGFFIRKERKTRSLARIIDGDLNDNPIVLVDDVYKSGKTIEKANVIVKSLHKKISFACTIVNFEWKVGREWSNQNNIPIESFFCLADFGLDQSKADEVHPRDRRSEASIKYEELWHFQAPNSNPIFLNPKSSPIVEDKSILIGSDSGMFWSLNADSGEIQWYYDTKTRNIKGIWSNPAVYNGKVFFGAYNGNIYCLDVKNGQEIWVSPICDWVGSSPEIISSKNIVVVGTEYARESQKGGIAALDIDTGEKIWEHQLNRLQHGSAVYWAEKNLVIAGSSDYAVLALNADNGKEVWKVPTQRSIKYPPAICLDKRIAATASFDGGIRIVSLDDGKLIFNQQTDDICYTTPLIVGDFLFCGSTDTYMYVINLKENKLERKIRTRGKIFAPPAIVDGNIIFGNSAGVLEEINAITLETENAIILPDAITNKVAVSTDNQVLFVPTYLNEIYAMRRTRLEN